MEDEDGVIKNIAVVVVENTTKLIAKILESMVSVTAIATLIMFVVVLIAGHILIAAGVGVTGALLVKLMRNLHCLV